MNNTLFLFHAGKAFPRLEMWASRRNTSFCAGQFLKLAHILENRRNPRGLAYMKQLAQRVFPDFNPEQCVVIEEGCTLPPMDWKVIEAIVLLWPDGNGTGWTTIERGIFRHKAPAAQVSVLNGRGRLFVLNRTEWFGFRWKRLLEKSLALELGFALIFIVTTPWLVIWDLMRGRR
ncbi:MAG: hypothetical protein ABIH23_01715 [bacterium]